MALLHTYTIHCAAIASWVVQDLVVEAVGAAWSCMRVQTGDAPLLCAMQNEVHQALMQQLLGLEAGPGTRSLLQSSRK
jgi:hypothetical protein